MEIRSLRVAMRISSREREREIKLKSNTHSISSCLLSRGNALTGFAVCVAFIKIRERIRGYVGFFRTILKRVFQHFEDHF